MRTLVSTILFLSFGALSALSADERSVAFAEMSLEELAATPVVRSGKDHSRLFDAPVNAYVFDSEAITHLPVDSIPELVRYAPGVHVTRPTNGSWGIAVRGMDSHLFGRVPFTIDDQNVGAAIFSGIYGSQHDLIFEDIASVEVVYGPGGVYWHNNGGNGAVNIVMKSAFETLGNYAQVRVGSENLGASARSGWTVNDNSAARVYGKYSERDASNGLPGSSDATQTARAGVRFDTRWTSEDLLSLTADIHGLKEDYHSGYPGSQSDLATTRNGGGAGQTEFAAIDLQAKWLRQISDNEGFTVRTWSSIVNLESYYAEFDMVAVGAETQARFHLPNDSEIVLSAGSSGTYLGLEDTFNTKFSESETFDTISHLGAQWTLPLVDNVLELTLALTGSYETMGDNLDFSPSIRFLYKPTERDRFWLSFTRATRPMNLGTTYTERFRGAFFGMPTMYLPGSVSVSSRHDVSVRNSDLDNEKSQFIELGYRRTFLDRGEFGIVGFYNEYKGIHGFVYDSADFRNDPDPDYTYWETRARMENMADAVMTGGDVYLRWSFTPRVRASLTYSYLVDSYTHTAEARNPEMGEQEVNDGYFALLSDSSPRHLATLWIETELNEAWRADLGFRYSSAYGQDNELDQDSIFQIDARLSWRYNDALSVSLVGRNLLDSSTDESGLLNNAFSTRTEQRREWYLEATYRF